VRVGVTGGAGFIGGWVCDELRARGHEPIVFDRRAPADFLGDVTDPVAVCELAAHVDGIIHLAAVLGTQETALLPRPAATVNVLGAVNVIEACKANDLPVVNICVGNHWMLNTYSSTKTCAERLFEQFRREAGLRVIQVRAMNAYGPRQSAPRPFGSARVRKIMPSFICRALSGLPVEVYGDGSQVSDCVFVGDVAATLVSALEHAADGVSLDRVVECGPTLHDTVNEVAGRVRWYVSAWTGQMVPVEHLPMRPGEEPGARVTADVSTLALVGIDADEFVPLDSGIARTVAWFAENEGKTWSRPA
jgi:UDP-glucose 4-epimerase